MLLLFSGLKLARDYKKKLMLHPWEVGVGVIVQIKQKSKNGRELRILELMLDDRGLLTREESEARRTRW